jgi:hypothetical protein
VSPNSGPTAPNLLVSAEDAAQGAVAGQRIVSIAALPIRHVQAYFGREGSGYETKVAVAVVYSGV